MDAFDLFAKRLVPYYSYFQVANRLLFTGHSHQAWPDVAFDGQKEAFMWAANQVDRKWEIVFQKAEVLRNYLRAYYQDSNGHYSFSANTHDLLLRWLSALDLSKKPKIITTDGEFYTVTRQLLRLEEEGIKVVWVPQDPSSDIGHHIQEALCHKTAAIICSHVFYRSSIVQTALYDIAQIAEQAEVPFLIDDYHGTHVIPLHLQKMPQCYVIGGGYKYLQWGEGNCFLRFPKACKLRPVITGWFASLDTLEKDDYKSGQPLHYDEGNMRFSGATYEPTSHFRAARVVQFFEKQQISATQLRNQYEQQIAYMQKCFLDINCPPAQLRLLHDCPASARGGFLSLQGPNVLEISQQLRRAGVATDLRGNILRFGAAPYLQKQQIEEAFRLLKKVLKDAKKT